ncbi:MAG: cytochrome c biogenesis protein CcsA [Verrucomicrobia bacterium]|nr:cytochrome c biogenesis protein CcsA [Verrucomicrobiota bacterium]
MKKRIFLLLGIAGAMSVFAGDLDFQDAGRMVIQAGGRKKPLDTFAAESLQTISGRQTLRDPSTGQRMEAMDALLSIWLGGRSPARDAPAGEWNQFPMVFVADPALRKELELPAIERRFSRETLLKNKRLTGIREQLQGRHARNEDLTLIEKEAEMVFDRLELLNRLMTGEAMTIVPDPAHPKGNWLSPSLAADAYGKEIGDRLSRAIKGLSESYRARDPAAFGVASREFREALAGLAPAHYPSAAEIGREVHYNHAHPFRWAWILYTAAFFTLLLGRGYRLGLGMFAAGLGSHLYGMVLRSWIAGRAPVTNMYESVIWVSLGIAAFALVFEMIYLSASQRQTGRDRVYALTAAPLAVLGLILADSFPSVLNPNIGPLPPVLRDNFWLVTHVLTITLGYAAFAMAMGLGHVILAKRLFRPDSIDERSHLHHLLYRVLQLGVFLLAVGTILGGVWANYAWGRFWGWDPKETWALIALLLYIFAIHGRMAGWWGNFGLSVAAAVCFNGVLMAWYGVNFVLGKGLHSYGFGGGGAPWVGVAVALDFVFVGICVAARTRQKKQSDVVLSDSGANPHFSPPVRNAHRVPPGRG